VEKVAVRSTKVVISLKRGNTERKLLLTAYKVVYKESISAENE